MLLLVPTSAGTPLVEFFHTPYAPATAGTVDWTYSEVRDDLSAFNSNQHNTQFRIGTVPTPQRRDFPTTAILSHIPGWKRCELEVLFKSIQGLRSDQRRRDESLVTIPTSAVRV